jgi:hypothetical protein
VERKFFQVIMFLFFVHSASAVQAAPSAEKLVNLLFLHMNEPVHDEEKDSVRTFMQRALSEVAAQGKKENSPPPAWSSASCQVQPKKSRGELLQWFSGQAIYPKVLAADLAKLKTQDLWECSVAWGVEADEVVWKSELRFFLDAKQNLVPNSFGSLRSP